MSADNPRQRPYKVWNADRSTRKGVAASNLYDLVRKGKVRLDLLEVEKVQVVLEADGTEVDEEYFKQLPDHTVFLILKPGERWYPPGVEAIRAAIHAIPRIVCEAMNNLELIDEAPSWKIMDNRGRVTVVLHWDQREIRRLASSSPSPGGGGAGARGGPPAPNHVPSIEGTSEADAGQGYQGGRRSPIVITAKIDGVSLDRSGSLEYSTKFRGNQMLAAGVASSIPVAPGKKETLINDVHVHVPGGSGGSLETCDFHCGVLHEEGGRIHINKSVATSPIQEGNVQQQQAGMLTGTTAPEARRPSPKGGAHVRFLDVQVSSRDRDSSESDTENAANEEDQLSERYLLLVDQLSVEQKRHLSIKDIGVILERLSSKIIDVERLEREKESDDIHNWTIKATIKGEVLREIGVVYNGHYYGISEHPGYF